MTKTVIVTRTASEGQVASSLTSSVSLSLFLANSKVCRFGSRLRPSTRHNSFEDRFRLVSLVKSSRFSNRWILLHCRNRQRRLFRCLEGYEGRGRNEGCSAKKPNQWR